MTRYDSILLFGPPRPPKQLQAWGNFDTQDCEEDCEQRIQVGGLVGLGSQDK